MKTYKDFTDLKPVDELSKGLLQRAANTARDDAGHQRHVSKTAASRVGDPNHPPGQNLKSKTANYKAAKRDYQAFKFSKAADKKEDPKKQNESHEYFGGGPFSGPKSDLAASVLRIAEKAAKDKEAEEEVKGFEKMSNDKLNQSVKDAYLDKVRGGM